MKRFFELQEFRKKEVIKTTVFTDSTLRMAQSVALRSDINCASGGMLGEIVNNIYDDHSNKDKDTIIVMAGTNDVLDYHSKLPERSAFTHNIAGSIVKLQKVGGERYKNARLVLVPPHYRCLV